MSFRTSAHKWKLSVWTEAGQRGTHTPPSMSRSKVLLSSTMDDHVTDRRTQLTLNNFHSIIYTSLPSFSASVFLAL